MADIDKIMKGLECCHRMGVLGLPNCDELGCPYFENRLCLSCWLNVLSDAHELLKEQKEEHKRMLSWLSKFCRHIDNGDKWLTDEENLEFFREKMKQQFGWFTD